MKIYLDSKKEYEQEARTLFGGCKSSIKLRQCTHDRHGDNAENGCDRNDEPRVNAVTVEFFGEHAGCRGGRGGGGHHQNRGGQLVVVDARDGYELHKQEGDHGDEKEIDGDADIEILIAKRLAELQFRETEADDEHRKGGDHALKVVEEGCDDPVRVADDGNNEMLVNRRNGGKREDHDADKGCDRSGV